MDDRVVVQVLVIIHILSTITAVGANMTYFVWLRRALNNPEARLYTLETIRMMERRFVLPSYIVVGISGLGLVDRSGRDWDTPWIVLSIALFLAVMAVGGLYARVFRGQIALAAGGDPDPEDYRGINQRSNVLAAALTAVVAFLIYLMVFQPGLWG